MSVILSGPSVGQTVRLYNNNNKKLLKSKKKIHQDPGPFGSISSQFAHQYAIVCLPLARQLIVCSFILTNIVMLC
jgi:hypothetical protein